jgi:hypothetical protein
MGATRTFAALTCVALTAAGCGSSDHVLPKTSDVQRAIAVAGIDLDAGPVDGRGCIVLAPSATNAGAVRSYGHFALEIAAKASCNDAETAGDDADGIRWARRTGGWSAIERLEDNLWLRMLVPTHELGDRQHALEQAAFHAFDAGN